VLADLPCDYPGCREPGIVFQQGTDKVFCPDHAWITDRETPEETKEREETWLVREETRRMLG
jgi:hypothetical protein